MPDPARFDRVAAIFEHARGLDTDSRVAYLHAECGDDAELRAELDELLASHAGSGVLDDPVPLAAPHTGAGPEPETIGPYRILECIGRGGMGAVYRAEQDHPRRTVAVKIMRAGLVSPDALERFEFEAAVLGRLQHPGIARIYEAGTDDSDGEARPFFAMELVDGVRLDRYLADEAPSLDDRLRLLSAICDAVQHAHQKGIIHRDLKPANILVTAAGDPRILDFGVARATDSDLQATVRTLPGQVVGTLAYMSPEQIDTAPDRLDTRSDVYALGVILYEMLADRLPYELGDCSIAGAARIIGEADPTPLTSISRGYRGDLGTIVRTALRKHPDERYQSASDLAGDVRRYLAHEPIQARPATAVYQFRKFARRHRGLVGGAAAAVLALILGIVGVAWQTAKVAEQSRLVAREAATRRDVADFLREMLTSLDPARTAGEPLTVRMMLDDAAVRLEDRFADAPLVRADLHDTVGSTYQQLGDYANAEGHLRLAIDGYEREAGLTDDRAIAAIATLALSLREMDRLEEAEALLLQTRDRLADDDPGVYELLNNLAVVIDALGRSAEAEEIFRAIYERALTWLGPSHTDTLFAQHNLAQAIADLGDPEEAKTLFESCLTGWRASLGDDHPLTINSIASLAAAKAELGLWDESDALMREAVDRSARVLGSHHLHTLRRRQNLIRGSIQRQDLDEATAQAEVLLGVCERELGPAHAETLAAVELLVTAIAFAGSLERAEAVALQWHARLESEFGPTNRNTGRLALLLYNVYDSWGKPELMAEWLQRVRESSFQMSESLERAVGLDDHDAAASEPAKRSGTDDGLETADPDGHNP